MPCRRAFGEGPSRSSGGARIISFREPSHKPQGGPPFASMNSNETMDETVQAALESVGVDERAAHFLLLMSGIAAGTGIIGTSILMLATDRSRRAMFKGTEGHLEPSVMGAPVSPQHVSVVMPLRGPQQHQHHASVARRRAQVFTAFCCTFGMCIAVVLHGIISNTLSKDTGLKWESYTLLLSAGCCWMIIQAGVLAIQLEPGRGYSWTSFGEAMLSGIAPFVADSFDTLKDTLFGGLCFTSNKGGLHVLGGISWAYLFLFHLGLMFHRDPRFLVELFSNLLSVFALPTRDMSSKAAGLSCFETAAALLGKQLAPTKRQLLLVENIPQAGFAVIYLAVEGGSLVVAFLNLATPAMQVLVSICCYLRVQKRLARWYAKGVDTAIDDGDAVLIQRLCSELGQGGEELLAQVALLSSHLRRIATSRALEKADQGHILVDDGEVDAQDIQMCRQCVEAGCGANGELDLQEAGLGSRPALLLAITAFARTVPWIDGLSLRCGHFANYCEVLTLALKGSGLKSLRLHGEDFSLVLQDFEPETRERLIRLVAPQSSCLAVIVRARCQDLQDLGEAAHDVNPETVVDDLAMQIFSSCLKSATDGDLYLYRLRLGGQKALLKAMASFAVSTVWVTKLTLADTGLTDDDVVALAPVLATGAGLGNLWLTRNSIGDRGAEALAAALPHISRLRVLHLDRNRIREPGARALAAKLSACPTLESLGMASNEVGAEAEEALEKACREHSPQVHLLM